ncbi:MAG TPA: TIGR04141 family sporadically distributed protein, partial [Puia sp.]|nr:TIGR04141 family sporadically distributed protein [Puia sp.]
LVKPAKVAKGYDEKIYVVQRAADPTRPNWAEIVQNFADLNGIDLDTASSGAILFVKVKGRIMGCCFGSSVANVNRGNIVSDFGLGAAFFRIKPRHTKSIESFTLSINPITNNRNATIPTSKDNFDLDLNLENITELSGFFQLPKRTILIKGKEFFSIPSPLKIDNIIALCEQLFKDYEIISADDNYKRLTSTKRIKEKALMAILDSKLCDQIKRKSKNIFLIDFEIIGNLNGYKLSPKGNLLPQLSIENFFQSMPERHNISVNYLKYKEIIPFDSNDQQLDSWTLYKCLFYELTIRRNTYILYKGNWYKIEKEYMEGLRLFIKDHEIDNLSDIINTEWNGNDDEGDFNKKAAIAAGGQCWDKILYKHPLYDYGIEFCDVLTKDFIIHVKKFKSSALNSHLLMQTAVSAQLLQIDPLIRKWISLKSKEIFRKNLILNNRFEIKNPNISFLIALMSNSPKSLADSLPFFSLLSFNFVIKRIQQSGFDVKMGKV